jgi:hypothetical protein
MAVGRGEAAVPFPNARKQAACVGVLGPLLPSVPGGSPLLASG